MNNKNRSINRFFRFVTIFPIAYFVVFFAVSFVFAILSVRTDNALYLYFLIGFAVVMLALYISYAYYTSHHFQSLFVRGLYNVTTYNFKNISDNNNSLIYYPNSKYHEFAILNNQISSLKTELDRSTFISGDSGYSLINLDYIDIENNIITFDSFKLNFEAIIFASQNYRNVIIELFYELGEDYLTDLEIILMIIIMPYTLYQKTISPFIYISHVLIP